MCKKQNGNTHWLTSKGVIFTYFQIPNLLFLKKNSMSRIKTFFVICGEFFANHVEAT